MGPSSTALRAETVESLWTFKFVLSFLVLLLTLCFVISSFSSSLARPPGPRGYPIIGNIFLALPLDNAWLRFAGLKKEYGDLTYFHGLGMGVLVVNSIQTLNDLLGSDKRSKRYSNRPTLTMAGELMRLNKTITLTQYGKELQESRKLAYLALNNVAVKRYHRVQEDLAASLCSDLVDNPRNFFLLVRLAAQRLVLSITYGLPIDGTDSEYITHAEATLSIANEALKPGAFFCDIFPAMKHLPSWLPFQKKAAHGRAMNKKFFDAPFEHVKREMREGTAKPSLVSQLLSTFDGNIELEERVKWVAGTMYGAGGETTYATVLTFILAMSLHPEFQVIAQKEIDAVIGRDRLPTISDKDELPYVDALIKETMRWHPVVPLGFPRVTAEDDIYMGYAIPKDTIVIPNMWSIAFEPNARYHPASFVPERFLEMDPEYVTVDPSAYMFGFGRRICAGKALAEETIFVLVSSILASFTISAPESSEGKGLVPEFGADILSSPKPFDCRIVPRSAERVEIVKQRVAENVA